MALSSIFREATSPFDPDDDVLWDFSWSVVGKWGMNRTDESHTNCPVEQPRVAICCLLTCVCMWQAMVKYCTSCCRCRWCESHFSKEKERKFPLHGCLNVLLCRAQSMSQYIRFLFWLLYLCFNTHDCGAPSVMKVSKIASRVSHTAPDLFSVPRLFRTKIRLLLIN